MQYLYYIIKILSKEYNGVNEHLDLRCMKCDYEWKAKFSHLKNDNTGCSKYVYASRRKYTIDFIKSYLLNEKIELLSNKFENINKPLQLKCLHNNCGNVWFATFGNLYNSDITCRRCSDRVYSYEYIVAVLLHKNVKLYK